MDSMAPVMIAISQNFQAMKLKGQPVKVGVPATEAEMSGHFAYSALIDPSLECDKLTKVDLKNATALQSF